MTKKNRTRRPTTTQPRRSQAPTFTGGDTVDYSASRGSLAQQLEKAHREIADLHARLYALRALDAATNRQNVGLLSDVAAALLLAREAELAVQSTPLDKSPSSHTPKKLEQPSPGGSTWHARRAVGQLRTDLEAAVAGFHYQREHKWNASRPDSDIPRLRCCKRDCPARDIKIKAWREVRGGRRIYAERCSSCGEPLTKIATEEPS